MTMCEICPKFKYAERHQIKCVKQSFYKCALFLLFWLLSTLWIYHFHCYSVSFLLLYLSFHFDSQHRHPDSPHFSHFHPDSPHSHADSPNPHSLPIPRIPALIPPHFPHSVPQFLILVFTHSLLSLKFLRICLRKIVALIQKRIVTTA